MSPPARSPDVKRLLEQSDWARGLALRLVGDAGLADDVVQDAFVAALERPPQGPGVRAWLGVVVRNLALRRRRREAARPGVERRAARREAVGGGEEALQRLELQRRLADLVLALDEPYRTAVVLRHVEGLSARELAARQGCSEEAARQRVARGLARLRAELDAREGGDRSAWCGAMAALYGAREGVLPASLTGAGAIGIGGTLVGAKTIVAVAAVGLTLGGAAWWMRDGESAGPALRPRAVEAIAPTVDDAAEPAREVEETAAPVASAARDAVRAEPEVAQLAAATGRLEGRTLDASGAPLEGVEVVLLADEGDDGREAATSDEDGHFAFESLDAVEAAAERDWRLHAERDGYVPLDVTLAGPVLGDLVLLERPVITGVVLRPDGTPAAPPGQVDLDVLLPSGEREGCRAEIDERGRFTATELVPGRLERSNVRVRGFGPDERRHDLTLEPGARHELTLRVPAGATVRGLVVDTDTETPVPFAEVWADRWTYDTDSVEPSTVADAEGRFELRGVQAHEFQSDQDTSGMAWVQASARAEGYLGRPFEASVVHANSEGVYEGLVLRIARANATVSGRVTWPDGTPAWNVPVYGLDDGPNLHFDTTNRDGRFAFEGLPPGPFVVCARTNPEHEDPQQGRVDVRFDLAAGAQETLELVIEPANGWISGRVLDGDGLPLEGVSVEAGEHITTGGLTVGIGQRRTTTDADGRYLLGGLGPGRYQVEISGPERREHAARPSHVNVDLEADAPRDDVDFELVPGVTYEGWIDVGDEDPLTFRVERWSLDDDERIGRVTPDGEGRFRFGGCWPEPCALVLEREGQRTARIEVGPASAEGLVLTLPR